MSNLRCPICGEEYSDTYKRCPFCEEEDARQKGKTLRRTGGQRLSRRKRSAGAGGVLLVVALVLALGVTGYFLFGEEIAAFAGIRTDTPDDSQIQTPDGGAQGNDPLTPELDPGQTGDPGTADDPGQSTDPGQEQPDGEQPGGPLALDFETITIPSGETARITASGGSAGIVWSSSNEHIAVVDGGAVTGVAGGSVTITAQSGEEKKTCAVTVTGTPWVSAAELSLNRSDFTLPSSDPPFQLKIKGEYSSAVTWASSNANVAKVSDAGVVSRGTQRGTATVTATVDGHVMECIVRVP